MMGNMATREHLKISESLIARERNGRHRRARRVALEASSPIGCGEIVMGEQSIGSADVIVGAVIASGLIFEKRYHYSQWPKLRRN
jgi:hypothetical protein